jgi:hypothetical protein
VSAIYADTAVPPQFTHFIELNARATRTDSHA